MKRFFCLLLVLGLFFPTVGHAGANTPVRSQKVYAQVESTYGGTPLDVIEEQISYNYKTVDSYRNPYELPKYMSSYTCGISAGGEIIGFYDRIYENLIPNHTGRYLAGKFFYASQDAEVNNMYDTLYVDMNATPEGVTVSNFINGVKTYTARKGRTAVFSQAMSGTNAPNTEAYKQALNDGKLLCVFVDTFNIISPNGMTEKDDCDYVTINRNTGAHIMVAYGYYNVSYYNSQNVCFRQDKYLEVATGFDTPMLGRVRINEHCVVDDAYTVEII